jgi:UDP-3-O-[3-hydroxymyristoyl] N-acetylglucosamine deacetylase/UDP-3-O-[3-hydroxymyristoyl] N-acetylglucosamine deacetylase/3-hydroxyacyl-[acyl-carrier-protein] dehydratase
MGQGVLAVSENCQGMSLRTCLGNGIERFDMIEHVMAALAGLQLDNVQVRCTAQEMPALDGSCLPLVLALQSVGKVSLPSLAPAIRISQTVRVGNEHQWVSIEPAEELHVEYRLDYGDESPIKRSTYGCRVTEESFARNISPARTFVTRTEAEVLQGRGLAKHVTERDLLVFGPDGPVNNQMRFSDECARHKALDLLGDLAVVGVNLVGKVIACRSGHQLNTELARKLRQLYLSDIRRSEAA